MKQRRVRRSRKSADFTELRQEAGLSFSKAAKYFGVTERTVYRWSKSGAPPWAIRLLRYRAGYLDELGLKGWRVVRGEIYHPDLKHGFRAEELLALHWLKQGTPP